jgi:hypothetical protein
MKKYSTTLPHTCTMSVMMEFSYYDGKENKPHKVPTNKLKEYGIDRQQTCLRVTGNDLDDCLQNLKRFIQENTR